jgi:hypothetical protein
VTPDIGRTSEQFHGRKTGNLAVAFGQRYFSRWFCCWALAPVAQKYQEKVQLDEALIRVDILFAPIPKYPKSACKVRMTTIYAATAIVYLPAFNAQLV